MMCLGCFAKSVVFMLNDAAQTKVYYQIGDERSKMIIGNDGSFSINDRTFRFDDVKGFYYSATDYAAEAGTEDGLAVGIVIITEDGKLQMAGTIKVYSLDGKLVRTASPKDVSLDGLQPGVYTVSNGKSKVKVIVK